MFKMVDRLEKHWIQMSRKSEWGFLVMIAETAAIVAVPLYLFYRMAPYIKQIPYFSECERFEIALNIWLVYVVLIMCISIVRIFKCEWQEQKAKKRLENRELSDYVPKYQKYVEFVENAIQSGEYKEVYLPDDWVKVFDEHLDMTARLRTKEEQDFTDFDVMACLMYALTYKSDGDGRIINVPFVFYCAKAFLRIPHVYQCKRIEGYELVLEQSESLKEVSFEAIDASILLEIQELISVYLSQTKYYTQVLQLADFLHIFYLRCDK